MPYFVINLYEYANEGGNMHYFSKKTTTVTHSWKEWIPCMQARGFTIVGITDIEILDAIRLYLDDNYCNGKSLRDCLNELTPLFLAHGLLNKKCISTKKIEKLYKLHMSYAFAQQIYKELVDDGARAPWWQFIAVLDSKTNPVERFLDGKIFHFQNPIWKIIFPPVCMHGRARVRNYTDSNLINKNLHPSECRILTKTVPLVAGSQQCYGLQCDKKTVWLDPKFSLEPESLS